MKTYWQGFLTSRRLAALIRVYFLALAFAVPVLDTQRVLADATTVPQTYMGQSATTAQSKLGNLGNFLVALSNKTFMIGLLVMLLAGIVGAILWCFGQRGIVINVLGGIVMIGLIVMVIGLVADTTSNGT
jgi:hypothetical protein